MKEWQKELYIYRLSPAPPKKDNLQEYINLYLAENDETLCGHIPPTTAKVFPTP
ncbi:MAG: hypothetical protein ACI4W1_00185 [Ruminococcus sp.]